MEAGFPLAGGGVFGKVKFNNAATSAVPAPQYNGIAVPSMVVLKNFKAVTLKTNAATHPIEPNSRICGNFSDGQLAIAIALVRFQVGM
jgi:hypothetical protein